MKKARAITVSVALILSFVLPLAVRAQGPTFAERLGWPAGSRVLILHSDDVGMSHASNVGTIEALEYGMVTSVSVMMPTPISGWPRR